MTDNTSMKTDSQIKTTPLRTLLIANRGEIACRIMRTAQRLGIRTVAVFSTVDQHSPHVALADVACPLAGTLASENYLNPDALLQAARISGADAIHPGYGFLSENAEFAQLCHDNGIRFVGPAAASIRAMGSKSAAKALMESSGVPLLPGYHGDDQDSATLSQAAQQIGYPVMLKASAGGGGKGMRIVSRAEDFADALNAVKREALKSFGDDQVLIERYIETPRHIEIQIFGDAHGNHIHLFERDCSIQRRHQKVLEEAPAPHMTDSWREQMGAAAVAAAKAIDYVGAGTVEFIVDPDQKFYFMEMNTRLQVEHPVTEMITGVDLVEWQLRVAAGEPLPCGQQDLSLQGHSIEARLYAEDTENQFLPATGKLELLQFPAASETLRIEAGVSEGNEISVVYDPMMAKIISYGADREAAINTLINALESTRIAGVANNAAYLCRVLDTAAFREARLSTAFLQKHAAQITIAPADDADATGLRSLETNAKALAALYCLLADLQSAQDSGKGASAQHPDGWRLNSPSSSVIKLQRAGSALAQTVKVSQSEDHYRIECGDQTLVFSQVHTREHELLAWSDGQFLAAQVFRTPTLITVRLEHQEHRFTPLGSSDYGSSDTASARSMLSPMPGKVIQVLVQQGEQVEQDQPVMIIEAMKMEHTIQANKSGVVSAVYFQQNDPVEANAQLLQIDETAESAS